ncbi:NmrA family transcriptional regulator [Desulfosarcina alkanivorans]|uniref:NmrA family transcriptional regulator n=1 Tax=Desulfosarcina alkanivorans TaxID=571177 RepID=A0A5K7YX66_9BACT|nr:NAD(P)H-binding protein [Desulfosarcina alkanivorans]BBO70874.1 NmrA family transcriptional regulator [Desulfosarcina alkanivorans]
MNHTHPLSGNIPLILGGTGKTGRRVVERLRALNLPVRIGSRSGDPAFVWEEPSTWPAVLKNVSAVYVVYYPDLAVTGAPDAIRAFTDLAVQNGVRRIVLLSGRGEEEAQRCERIVQNAGIDWTIVRASWFHQNFSEGAFREMVLAGEIALPAGNVGEPFIDTDDIADVVVAALTKEGHSGQVYEVTGPRLLTFAEATEEIAKAAGRSVVYRQISNASFAAGLASRGGAPEAIALMRYLFGTVLDGRNAHLNDGVERALGRQPKDFTAYAQQAAAAGAWGAEFAA